MITLGEYMRGFEDAIRIVLGKVDKLKDIQGLKRELQLCLESILDNRLKFISTRLGL